MTHIEQAIKEAVEKGGYDAKIYLDAKKMQWIDKGEREVFLDPAFWQALAQVPLYGLYSCSCREGHRGEPHIIDCPVAGYRKPWLEIWHRFIDHLAENKSAEEFFASL